MVHIQIGHGLLPVVSPEPERKDKEKDAFKLSRT
jgi:hypothetical protein